MFKIAICDDEKEICNNLEEIILDYKKSSGINIEVEVYFSGETLYKAMQENTEFDLVFLDIELYQFSGVDIGKKIREELNNQTLQIVYISAKEQYAMELFAVRPLNFLIKPLEYQSVIENITMAIKLNHTISGYFTYKIGSVIKKILLKDIIYFESTNRQIDIITTEGTEIFYGKLDQAYETVKEHHFLYIHKSYLVNYACVEKFTYKSLLLTNGISLPISQQRRKSVRQQILQFDKEGILL